MYGRGVPNPLIRSDVARLLVGLGVAALAGLGGLVILVVLFRSMFGDPIELDAWLVLAVIQIVAAPVAGWAIVADERPTRLSTVVKLSALAITVVSLLVAIVLAVRHGVRALEAQPRLGIPSRNVALPFVAAAAASLTLALLVAAVRWPATGRRVLVGLGAGALALTVGIGSAGAVVYARSSCDAFRFDAARWDRVQGETAPGGTMARAIVRCHVLQGHSRADVERMLGATSPRRAPAARWREWRVGTDASSRWGGVRDAGGFLAVRFDDHGRVDRARYRVVQPID